MLRVARIARILTGVIMVVLLAGVAGPAEINGPLIPSKSDKCPVCGMFIYKYPDWTAQVVFKDGSGVFFDGAKDMFKYLLDLNKYGPGRSPEDIAGAYVSEYYDMKTIDAAEAYFVVGSDVYGPMGHELIPLATRKDAETFKMDHKGKEILKFREVTRELIKTLD